MHGFNARVNEGCALALLLAVATLSSARPAHAQAQPQPQPQIEASGTGTVVSKSYDKSYAPGGGLGLIIISRDFGPRNAIIPEVGQTHTIDVSPDVLDTAFADAFGVLTDDQVAQISSGTGTISSIGATVVAPTEMLAGNENIMREGGASIGGPGGMGSTISGAIGQGMSALTGALGGLGGASQ